MPVDYGDIVDEPGEQFDVHFGSPKLNRTIRYLSDNARQDIYYDEISYEKYRDTVSLTDYYITYIPNKDSKGELIPLKHGFQNDLMNSGVGESARSFCNRHVASLVANASIWTVGTGLIKGVQIQDGIIKQDVDGGTSYTLGIKGDNTLVTYPPTTKAATILKDGCINALTGFFPLITGGTEVDPSIYGVIGNPVEPNPRNVIAQLPNKDILFLSCEGRTDANIGMTYADIIRILKARGVTTAYCLDGGGSTQTIVRGLLVNTPIDDGGKTERKVADFLYIDRPSINAQNFKTIAKDMGTLDKQISDLKVDFGLLGKGVPDVAPNIGNLNSLTRTGSYWCQGSALNSPGTANSWGVYHFQAGSASALQVAFPYHGTTGSIMLRRTVSDMSTWTAWRAM